MQRWKKILIAILGIIALLIILCYLFGWPFPVFCCLFHNWCNHNILQSNTTDWLCWEDNGTYNPPPTYTCSSSTYPECGGTCPPGEMCVDTIAGLCKCVIDDTGEPEQTGPLCSTLEFPYCDDGYCPTGQWCQGVYDETGPHCECSLDCYDSDGGPDKYNEGVCSDFSGLLNDDECMPDSTLMEYWCEDGKYCAWGIIECGAGYYCAGGECKPIPDCYTDCQTAGYPDGGYFNGGVSCNDFEMPLPNGCCCYAG